MLGEYIEEGALHGRPYFRKQNSTVAYFMFFSGRRWLVSDVLDKQFAKIKNREIWPDQRDSFPMRLLQKLLDKIRVREQSCNLPRSGWCYSNNGWNEDASLLLDWLSPEPCQRAEGGGGRVVRKKNAHRWKEIVSLEKASRKSKKTIASLLFITFGWVRFIRSKILP